MDRDFFEDLYSEIPHPWGNIMIGLKSSTWTDNTYPVEDSFESDFILKIQRYSNGNIIARFYSAVSNPNAGNSTLTTQLFKAHIIFPVQVMKRFLS